MNKGLHDLLVLNVIAFAVVATSFALMVLWSRTTRGVWPSGKKLAVLGGVNVGLWVYANVMLLYFRAH
jgi:hypothetical protein